MNNRITIPWILVIYIQLKSNFVVFYDGTRVNKTCHVGVCIILSCSDVTVRFAWDIRYEDALYDGCE